MIIELLGVLMRECGGFEFLEHTADVLVKVRAKKLEKLFELSAKAMFEVITDTSKVEPRDVIEVKDSGFDLENALYKWLEDLLIEYGASNYVFTKFDVDYVRKEDEDYVFKGKAFGEIFDHSKHEPRTEVKAVTYSLMKIEKAGDCWIATFVLDI